MFVSSALSFGIVTECRLELHCEHRLLFAVIKIPV